MLFEPDLIPGRLRRRFQRFLAEVDTDAGPVLAHCPNTGAMPGLCEPGLPVWLSPAARSGRRCAYTWELVEAGPGLLVGVHTGRANGLVAEAIDQGWLPSLAGYAARRAEAVLPDRRGRIDFLLGAHPRQPDCWLEVKNVTALVEEGVGLFPDARTERGTRHVRALMALRKQGSRAALVFCVQRPDVEELRPADRIDPAYGRALREARDAGVELLALRAVVSPQGIHLKTPVPVVCP